VTAKCICEQKKKQKSMRQTTNNPLLNLICYVHLVARVCSFIFNYRWSQYRKW